MGSAALALALLDLPHGTLVRGAITGGRPQTFTVSVPAGRFVYGAVDQRDVDLVVRVIAPDGQPAATFDSRDTGVEIVAFVGATDGTYRIVVEPAGKTVGAPFTLRFEAPQPSDRRAEASIEAAALATEVRALARKGGREALQQAAERSTRAAALWREASLAGPELVSIIATADAFYALSEYARAEPLYQEALARCESLAERRTCASANNNLGVTHWRLGDTAAALTTLQRAIHQWRALGSKYGEAGANSNRGLLLQEVGRYDEARRHFQRSLILIRSVGDRRGEAFVQNNIGAALDQLGQPAAGLRALRRAVTLFREVGDRLAEGRALLYQSQIHFRRGARAPALADARAALRLIQEAGNRAAEADGQLQLGRILAADDPDTSIAHLESALTLYQGVGSRRGEAEVRHALGVAATARGEHARAIELLTQALESRRSIGFRRLEAETLYRLARAERGRGDLTAARSHLEETLAVVDTLHAGLFERELRSSYLGSNRGYHAEYVDVLVALHRSRPAGSPEVPADRLDALAYTAAERMRARGLTESMRTRWAAAAHAGPAPLRQREQTLREQINQQSFLLWQQAGRPDGGAREADLRATVDRLLRQYSEVEAELVRATPGVQALLRAEPITLDAVQRELADDDTTILQYVLGEQRSYLFVITRAAMEIHDLPARRDIETAALAFHRLLATAPTGDRAGAARTAASRLGRLLLSPLAGRLAARRIVIVPDGALHYVPFAAIADPASKAPLMQARELVTVPSATTLALVRRAAAARPVAPKTVAIVADPVFDRADVRVTAVTRTATAAPPARRLSRLPYSRDEADAIFALAPPASSLKALDFEATRALVTGGRLKPFRFVHLAAHALQDDENPGLSGVVFSLVDRNGTERDGFLRLQDMHTLALDAELVVLSACSTGLAAPNGGVEGLASLARGLFAARVPAVISSLWKIDDEATAELMTHFYRALLKERRRPAAALRAAQMAMVKGRFSDPYFWSGFVLQGTW